MRPSSFRRRTRASAIVRIIKALSRLQDALGQGQDAGGTAVRLTEGIARKGDDAAVGAVRGWVAAQTAVLGPDIATCLEKIRGRQTVLGWRVTSSRPLLAPYRAPRWLAGRPCANHLSDVPARGRPVRYRRERVDTPDGDFWDFDWLATSDGAGQRRWSCCSMVSKAVRALAIRARR